MNEDPKPVSHEEYNAQWLRSAWGEAGNEELLRPGRISPRPRVRRAIDLCRLQPGLRLLDIACGRGEVPAIVCQNGAIGVGLDYSADAMAFAQKVRAVHRTNDYCGDMELVRGDATILPFPDSSFDRVTMLDIIEHLYPAQLLRMFREVHRVLRSDGFAVLHTLPNRWVYDVAYPLAHRLFRVAPRDPRGEYEKRIHVNEQDIIGLHQTISEAKLSHRIWLEQHIPAQARWNAGQDRYNDSRDSIYPVLAGIAGRVMEVLSFTPLKLVLCNDIFGVLWKGAECPEVVGRLPTGMVERAVCMWGDRGNRASI